MEADNAKRISKLLGLRFETNKQNCNYILLSGNKSIPEVHLSQRASVSLCRSFKKTYKIVKKKKIEIVDAYTKCVTPNFVLVSSCSQEEIKSLNDNRC